MSLEQTLKDNNHFQVFSLALMMVAKSSRLLLEGGANPEAIKHINKAVELISRQLDSAAVRLETELHAVKNVDDLFRKMNIPKTN